MKTLLAVLLFLVSIFPLSAQTTVAVSTRSAVEAFEQQTLDATFALYGQRVDPKTKTLQKVFLCTAFAHEKDATGYLILSAGHCVSNMPSDVTFVVAEDLGGPVQPLTVISAREEDEGDDYALFHLTTTKNYPVIPLGDDTESISSREINPNFAYGLVKELAHGVVASGLITNPVQCACRTMFVLHEFAGQGASGSPVISETTHKVVGILVGQISSNGFTVEPVSRVKAAFLKPNQYEQLHQKSALEDLFEQLLQQSEK